MVFYHIKYIIYNVVVEFLKREHSLIQAGASCSKLSSQCKAAPSCFNKAACSHRSLTELFTTASTTPVYPAARIFSMLAETSAQHRLNISAVFAFSKKRWTAKFPCSCVLSSTSRPLNSFLWILRYIFSWPELNSRILSRTQSINQSNC